jgi:outer membrane protein assembly factor BamB
MRIRAFIVFAGLAVALLCVASGVSSTLASGAKLWAKRYNAGGNDYATAVASSPDGTKVFVTGQSYGGMTTGDDYVTIAYNGSSGQQSWLKRYNGPGNKADGATAIAVSADGSKLFVTGESYGSSTTGTAYATVAYNASSGAQLWVKRYNGPVNGSDRAFAIAVSPDGTRVFVTGGSYSGSTKGSDYATVAYDGSTGAQLWAKRYEGPGAEDEGRGIAVSADGSKVFVTGEAGDYATIGYNASTGSQLWAKRYNGPGNGEDYGLALALSPTGTKVFVTGFGYTDSAKGFDYGTVAYNTSTGSQLWASRYNGAGSGGDFAYGVAVSGDGAKVFVTGQSDAGASDDYATVAYNSSTGAKLWSTRYDGPAGNTDGAYAIGVNPAGTKVFVTGESYGGPVPGYDAATVAYNTSTGSKLWASRYNGPDNRFDGFFSLAVSVDGTKVFVAGQSQASTLAYDALTAAYQG